jgi:hypothetical protein
MTILHLDGHRRTDAGLAEAEAAIRRLDGTENTLVRVELSSGKTLTIGGGPGSVIVELADNSRDRWCVVDPTQGKGSMGLTVGGARADYPVHQCVSIEAALEAVRVFLTSDGERSACLMWSMRT